MKGVKVGLDRTASELAIVRLGKEISELEKLYETKKSISDLAAKKAADNINTVNAMNTAINNQKKRSRNES